MSSPEITATTPSGRDSPAHSGTQTQNPKVQQEPIEEMDVVDAMDISTDPLPVTTITPAAIPFNVTGGLSPPPPPLGIQDTTKQSLGFARSQSPAKRPASEMDGDDDEVADYPLSPMSVNNECGGVSLCEPEFASSGSIPPTAQNFAPMPFTPSATSAPESASGTGVPTVPPTAVDSPSTLALAVAPDLPPRSASPPPSIEEQIQVVFLGIHRPMEEGSEYCMINGKWLRKFLSYEPSSNIQLTKEEAEAELGPIDNSCLVDNEKWQKMVTENIVLLDPTAAQLPANVNGTVIDADFVPLVQGISGEDFDLVPLDTWEYLVKVHGVTPNAPPPFKRKVINTQSEPQSPRNLQVELYPPTFTIFKLRDPSTGITPEIGARPAPQIIAGRAERVNALLKKAKFLAGIDMTTKVRIWRLTNAPPSLSWSGSVQPMNEVQSSREGSEGMILDMNVFLEMEAGSERELVTIVTDNTNNSNYNGQMNINMAGLSDGGALLLEENVAGDWISERATKATTKPGSFVKNGLAKIGSLVNRKANSANSSRSSSPARNASQTSMGGIMTRGREKKPGRPLGCCGLQNLGNTCYMNSALQCLRNCEELTKYFLSGNYKGELNPSNPLSHGGNVARSYANLLGNMFSPTCPASFAPREFKSTIGRFGPSFSGYGQQDSQEFLAFLLDGLHEDLNRIHQKPYMEKPDSTDEMVGNDKLISELADKCWGIYKARNDSAVADLFGGMYKSTLVCPECDKVSITFDPFMDLTLPLPVENIWSKEILFYPSGGKDLLRVPVDMDKNSNIRGLKEYIGRKLQIDPKKLMGSEMFKNKFFKHYEDSKGVCGEIQARDNPIFYELEAIPTNYPPPRRSMITRNDDWELQVDKLMDTMLVPVFSRRKGRLDFGFPFFITLAKEELKDYDTILAKVCERYQSQTTMPLFEDRGSSCNSSSCETPDEVVVDSEDDSINDGKRLSENDGEEGYVDVRMVDVEEAEKVKRHKYSKSTLDSLNTLFTMKIGVKHQDRSLPTNWGDLIVNFELASRIMRPMSTVKPLRKPYHSTRFGPISDESEEDYDNEGEEKPANALETQDSGDESTQVDDQVNISFTNEGNHGESSPEEFYGKRTNNKKSKLYREPIQENVPNTPPPQQEQSPLLRLGEAIVCEWEEDKYDLIFGGGSRNESRGYPLWEFNEMQFFHDEELLAKRRMRENRRKRGIHLEDCLSEFSKDEILSETDPWYCPRCKEFRRAHKKFELWKSPDILVIHLKRFSSSRISRDKIDALIDFPVEGLDLSDRVGHKEEGKGFMYDLFAVDNHYGGLGGGHYTAYAKNFEDGKWYTFDDSSVSTVLNPVTVVTTAAYLLFYRRRNNNPLGGPLFEKILGGSKSAHLKEESGNGGADNGNDSGISDNSPSSSPHPQGGVIGAPDSSDNSRSSSPLVSGQLGSSAARYKSFGGAGSSTNIFDTATPLGIPPSPQGSNSSSGLPSYDAAVEDRLFGPMLPQMGRDDMYDPPKAVNFTFGNELRTNGAPTTPTSTPGDMGDSDKDADGEDDVDMLGDVDIVVTEKERFLEVAEDSVTEYMVGADEGLGVGVDDDCNREVHDVELSSPEREEERVMDINV